MERVRGAFRVGNLVIMAPGVFLHGCVFIYIHGLPKCILTKALIETIRLNTFGSFVFGLSLLTMLCINDHSEKLTDRIDRPNKIARVLLGEQWRGKVE